MNWMTIRRWILFACLGAYVVQVAVATYTVVRPTEVRVLDGAPVTATVMKDFENLDFVPVIGVLSLLNPQGYRVVLCTDQDSKTLLLDLKEDLPVSGLWATREASMVVVFDDRSGRRVAELVSSRAGR